MFNKIGWWTGSAYWVTIVTEFTQWVVPSNGQWALIWVNYHWRGVRDIKHKANDREIRREDHSTVYSISFRAKKFRPGGQFCRPDIPAAVSLEVFKLECTFGSSNLASTNMYFGEIITTKLHWRTLPMHKYINDIKMNIRHVLSR